MIFANGEPDRVGGLKTNLQDCYLWLGEHIPSLNLISLGNLAFLIMTCAYEV